MKTSLLIIISMLTTSVYAACENIVAKDSDGEEHHYFKMFDVAVGSASTTMSQNVCNANKALADVLVPGKFEFSVVNHPKDASKKACKFVKKSIKSVDFIEFGAPLKPRNFDVRLVDGRKINYPTYCHESQLQSGNAVCYLLTTIAPLRANPTYGSAETDFATAKFETGPSKTDLKKIAATWVKLKSLSKCQFTIKVLGSASNTGEAISVNEGYAKKRAESAVKYLFGSAMQVEYETRVGPSNKVAPDSQEATDNQYIKVFARIK